MPDSETSEEGQEDQPQRGISWRVVALAGVLMLALVLGVAVMTGILDAGSDNEPTVKAPTAAATATMPAYLQNVPRITAPALKEKIDAGVVLVVDVRSASAYAANHIVGAISIPWEQWTTAVPDLPKDKGIVTYCG